MASRRFSGNAPRVVDETVDGETLIIDMMTGSYFSCVGASSTLWAAFTGGASVDEATEMLATAYGVPAGDIAADAERFADELLSEELLVEAGPADDGPAERLTPPAVAAGDAYESPRLQKYTDLADLILLDPVHDVSAAGWPSGTD